MARHLFITLRPRQPTEGLLVSAGAPLYRGLLDASVFISWAFSVALMPRRAV